MSAVIFQVQSTFILLLMYLGVYYRKKREIHVKMMASAIIWDVLLILQIELTRSAVAKALKPVENSLLLNFHILIALLTVFLYIGLILTGRKMLGNDYSVRSKHKTMGILTLIFRTSTYVTSFFVVN
jgi:predicted membrane protein